MTWLKKAISFAKHHAEITDQEDNIIMQARKTFLFYDDFPFIKKEGKEDFDIPMVCFDGSECCELVGSYILNLLGEVTYKVNFGLYEKVGLGIFENLSGPQIERKETDNRSVQGLWSMNYFLSWPTEICRLFRCDIPPRYRNIPAL